MTTAPATASIADRWVDSETGAGGGHRPQDAPAARCISGSSPAAADAHGGGRSDAPAATDTGTPAAVRAGTPAGLQADSGNLSGDPAVTIHSCARTIMEVVPAAMRVLRMEMRRPHRGQLSVPQFRALLFIQRHPGISASQLAEHLGVTRPTASALLDRLVQRGLVSRVRDPQERRRVVLHLTPAGVRLIDESRRHTQERLAARLAGVPAQELDRIVQGLQLLQQVMRGMVK